MRGGDEADAAKAAAAGRDHRLQHLFGTGAERQIGITDDTGADPDLAIRPGCGHRRDAIGEFDLAEAARPDRWPVHRQSFEVDGRRDVVASRAGAACGDGIGRSRA